MVRSKQGHGQELGPQANEHPIAQFTSLPSLQHIKIECNVPYLIATLYANFIQMQDSNRVRKAYITFRNAIVTESCLIHERLKRKEGRGKLWTVHARLTIHVHY